MRRAILTAAVAFGVLVSMATPASAASLKITLQASPTHPVCGTGAELVGTATPWNGTSRVMVQRTVNGRWVDWKWYSSSDTDAMLTRLAGVPDDLDGGFFIDYLTPVTKHTLHLRVRSNGGSVVSNGVYVTPKPGHGLPC